MIKDIVVALLTTTINRYSELRFSGNMIPREIIIKDLTGTLDYVADIPEDKQPVTVVLGNNEEVERLKSYIRELEDSCENMNQVEENLAKQIEELKEENQHLRNRLGASEMDGLSYLQKGGQWGIND